MNSSKCKTCLYEDICESQTVCTHYTPTDDEMTTTELDEYIENDRREFHNEWWKYMAEC